MTNDINATFETRRAAELAIEHLVQEHGVARTDVMVDADGSSNSSGTVRSGGDAAKDAEDSDTQPKLAGAIRVSVKSGTIAREAIEAALQEAGGSLDKQGAAG
jgi:hypothetical protein